MICSVVNCKNSNFNRKKENSVHFGFHVFPKCPILLKKWIKFCMRKDKINVKNARICSQHFTEDDFQNNLQFRMGFSGYLKLKPGAVPSIHFENEWKDSIDDNVKLKKLNRPRRIIANYNKKLINEELSDELDGSEIPLEETEYINVNEIDIFIETDIGETKFHFKTEID